MTTARTLIQRALAAIGHDESLGDDAVKALPALNALLDGWEASADVDGGAL